jgi:AcrR family transcriptional regulator
MVAEMASTGQFSRKEQKAKTRKLILEAAILEFGQNGYEETNISNIAKRADVSHGNVFAHFTSKEELFTKAIEEFGQRVVARLDELSQTGASLENVLSVHLRVISEFEDLYSQTVAKSFALPEFARQSIVSIQSAVSHEIAQAVKKDMAKGKIINIPVHMLFNTWTALINYYLVNRNMFTTSSSVVEEKGEEILDFFMTMLSKRG